MVVPVIEPEQLSVAVGAVKLSTLHCAVTSSRSATSATGAKVSYITTVCVCVVTLPSASTYVQVTTVVPCAVIGSTVVVVPVMEPAQLSVAVGAVKLSTLHSAVTSARAVSYTHLTLPTILLV